MAPPKSLNNDEELEELDDEDAEDEMGKEEPELRGASAKPPPPP